MDKKKLRVYVLVAAVALSVLLFAVGWLVLPDPLTVQIAGGSSTPNTLPKPIGLGLPAALTIGFAVAFFFDYSKTKYLVGSAIGVLMFCLTFLFNIGS